MAAYDYSGYWTGTFEGTHQGGLTLDLKQNGSEVTGIARLAEPAHVFLEFARRLHTICLKGEPLVQ